MGDIAELPGASYYSNWITMEEQDQILGQIQDMKFSTSLLGITGRDGPELFAHLARSKRPAPLFIKNLIEKLSQQQKLVGNIFQVTVNNYTDLSKYIVPHKDGNGKQAAIISVGPSHTVLNFYDHPQDQELIKGTKIYDYNEYFSQTSVWMEPLSCLILTEDSYMRYAHGITPHLRDQVVTAADSSVVSSKETGAERICNGKYLSLAEGTVVERGPRISIVIWSK